MCAVGVTELEGPVDTARAEADHVEDIQCTQEAEVRLSVLLPLQAHQLFHWGLFEDLASLSERGQCGVNSMVMQS